MLAIEIHNFDSSEPSIDPVQMALLKVDGQTIEPFDVNGHDTSAVAGVHSSSLYPRSVSPLSPEHKSICTHQADEKALIYLQNYGTVSCSDYIRVVLFGY